MNALSISKPINALVLAVGSPLGQSICKALRLSRLPVALIPADSDEMSAGLYLNKEGPGVVLPPVRHPDYFSELVRVLKKYRIQVIFPVIGPEFEFFHDHRDYFEKENIRIVSVGRDALDCCNDKYEGMRYLRRLGVSVPDTALCVTGRALDDFLARAHFPLLMKPRKGSSNRDVYVVRGLEQLMAMERAFPPGYFVVQAYLGDGDEYTVGVYIARKPLFPICHRDETPIEIRSLL